ncbi:MAG: MarR family transcriptional regulator [Clostridiales bacterium]|nr:MarR family transcriptional regulator [Clostridiales bacterium]
MKREKTVGFVIKTLDKMLTRNQMATMERLKANEEDVLPFMHGWIIAYLYDHRDEEVYQKDLEAEFSIARSTVTGIVKQLEKKGYITRVAVDRDCRLKCLGLTQKGLESHEKIEDIIQEMERRLSVGIDEEDMDVFLEVASKIRVNLSNDFGNDVFSSWEYAEQKEDNISLGIK